MLDHTFQQEKHVIINVVSKIGLHDFTIIA